MKTHYPISRIAGLALTLALILGFGAAGLEALAQGNSPTQTPYPTQTLYPTSTPYPTYTPASSGTEAAQPTATSEFQSAPGVKWAVSDMTFQSNYPNGFQFSANITSSAGPVVRGRVVWSHAPGRQRTHPIEIDTQTGMVTAAWEPGTGESTPPWVGITYHWEVGDSAGNTFATEPQYVEYEDKSRTWTRTESDDIIVFSEGLPAEVNQSTMEAMATQRETYRQAWGDLLPYKPRAILFGDQDAWLQWRIGASNPRVIGQTTKDWGGTAQIVTSNGDIGDLAYGTVPHEIAHLYQEEFTVMFPGTWFIEGNATFFELHQMYNYEDAVRQLAASGKLPALLAGTGPGVSGQNARRGYDIGYTFWKWLVDNYGLEGHHKLIQLIKKGTSRDDAIQQVTGLSLEEVESRWRTWLGASPIPPTLYPTPTIYMLPSPTPYRPGGKN